MAQFFTNLVKSTVHSVKFYKGKRNILKTAPKHIMIKLLKTSDKGKNIKSSQRKKTYFLQKNQYNDIEFLSEIIQTRSYTKIQMNFLANPICFTPIRKLKEKEQFF